MAEIIVLPASKRQVVGKKVKTLRKEGFLPAVVYGSKMEPLPIQLNMHETQMALRKVSSSTLITLDIDGEEQLAVIRDRQFNRLKNMLMHLDFLAVAMGETLRVNVPIRLTGVSPVVKAYSALVIAETEYLEIESLPKDLPSELVIDISILEEIGDSISVADLDLPEGVTVFNEPDTVLAVAIAATRVQTVEEEEEEELEEGAEPEVLSERGGDEDDEE